MNEEEQRKREQARHRLREFMTEIENLQRCYPEVTIESVDPDRNARALIRTPAYDVLAEEDIDIDRRWAMLSALGHGLSAISTDELFCG